MWDPGTGAELRVTIEGGGGVTTGGWGCYFVTTAHRPGVGQAGCVREVGVTKCRVATPLIQ